MIAPEKILEAFGLNAQRRKAAEECAELICELMRFECGRGDMNKLAEELADVSIMIDQLATLCPAEYRAYRDMKYERIAARIAGLER
jgi:NTP pyrophosphatase (non-canonical NTP hydrolase)